MIGVNPILSEIFKIYFRLFSDGQQELLGNLKNKYVKIYNFYLYEFYD
jgi:hypothetical protein